jgi:hypothetical protein
MFGVLGAEEAERARVVAVFNWCIRLQVRLIYKHAHFECRALGRLDVAKVRHFPLHAKSQVRVRNGVNLQSE